jgi:hypothetical protein
MGTVLALILILQVRMNPPAAAVNFPDFPDDSPAAQAAYEERDLAHRYNVLARALNDFMAAYKAGHVDLKKAKAVRNALHDLEKFDWFKPELSPAEAKPGLDK